MIRHRFDEQLQHDVIDVGPRTYPLKWWHSEETHGYCVRQAMVMFENRWALSIIWGSMNYSDNYEHHGTIPGMRREESQPFVEEPNQVEVGVMSPEPRILKGMDPETLAYFNERYPADPKTIAYMAEDKPTDLACDPFGWLDADAVNRLADAVRVLPSHPADVEAIGEELEARQWDS